MDIRFMTNRRREKMGLRKLPNGEWHDDENGVFYVPATFSESMHWFARTFWWLPMVLSGIALLIVIISNM